MKTLADEIRVLHVDDDPDIVDVTSAFLEREVDRFTVRTATTAADGLDAISNGDVDCIVSDYDMPGTNGIEFLRTVRERRPDLPFILYTGKGSEEIASRAISAGVTDYLQKETGTDHYTVLANRIENAVERFRTERALQATRRQYEKVVEQNLAGIYIIQHGEFVYVNPKLAEIHGYDRNTIIGMSPLELIAPEERDRVEENLRKRLEGEVEDIQYQTVGLTKDGEHIDIELHGSHIEYGGEPAVIGAELDISERKERERELERYEAIVENSEDGIYVFDEDGRFEFVNNRVAAVSDIPREEWFDSHVSVLSDQQIVSEEEVTAIERGIRSVANDQKSEVRITLQPDVRGDIRHLELRLTPLRTADGSSRVIGFSRDVTDQVERASELERQNDRLNRFSEIVSHDLRNPLRVAESSLELGREECDNEHFQRVSRSHDRMDTLINDLLTVARTGENLGTVEVVDLEECVRESWANVDTADASLRIADELRFSANRNRLLQLLENLFRNAIDHGGEDVTVTVGDVDGGFYVEDDGLGIPEGERDHVFDAGYSTTEDGTGFGLSIVNQVAQAHGWDVRVTDGAEGGARFEFTGVEIVAG